MPGRRPAKKRSCGLNTISVRVWTLSVLVGTIGSGKLDRMEENQPRVDCSTMPLPLALGHSKQTCWLVRVSQEGQFQTRRFQIPGVSLMCLCTAKLASLHK